MRHRLPPLNALRLFEAAARHLSFRNAADELLLTPSAVSHGIQSLEQWLGTPLFLRTAKGLVLTDAGAAYHPQVQAALALLAESSRRVGTRERRTLRISAAPTFANRLLVPALEDFRRDHPDISVSVDTAHDCIDLGENDIAIRVGRGGWPGVIAEELLHETLLPVCAPERLRDFADKPLADLPLIHVTTVSEDWARWATATGRAAPATGTGLRFDTLQMAFDAAARGLGVAIGRRPLVDTELQSGRLVPLWPSEVRCESVHWLVSRASADGSNPAVATFCAWLKARPLGGTARDAADS